MKALKDDLKIGHGFRDDRDQPLEPEEQPVDRKLETVSPVLLGNAPGEGTPASLPMRVNVTAETTAGEIAADLSRECQFCRWWDRKEYQDDRRCGVIDPDELDEQRAHVLELASAEELTAFSRTRGDQILDISLGRCHALSDAMGDTIYTHVRAGCPSYAPDGTSLPNYFEPHPEAKKIVAGIRDQILRLASGKKE